jgi:hypothetical protein
LTGTKTFIAGLQSLLIDVDVNVSFAFYAAAFQVPAAACLQAGCSLAADKKKNGRSILL